jgi:3D-(3,5/4)-trihydroxycyclohexane-1,2-dione acylhydrolase (decyclizing)
MRRGAIRTRHPYKAGPFYLLLPINRQPERIAAFNLAALPGPYRPAAAMVADPLVLAEAAALLRRHHRIAIKAGGGARSAANSVRRLAEAIGAVVVLSPGSTGVLPDAHPRNMHVGGSKGSISGNYAMAEADLLMMVGSRAVCQADCSGIGFPKVEAVVNLNGDLADAQHYNRTTALVGDIDAVAGQLLTAIEAMGGIPAEPKRAWLEACVAKKREWREFREARYAAEALYDPVWGGKVLTQPAAIKTVADFAKRLGAVKYFDAGDVQANGFQIVEDDAPFETFTESGASYMGFAASALLASALADMGRYGIAFCGDGSFMMNPQVLVDAVEHGARGMIVVFDNRRMGAISSLQHAQYGIGFRTGDSVGVDYCRLGEAIAGVKAFAGGATRASLQAAVEAAHAYRGLSLVHVPVYFGGDPVGGLGAYGDWNIGNWCSEVQARWQAQDL